MKELTRYSQFIGEFLSAKTIIEKFENKAVDLLFWQYSNGNKLNGYNEVYFQTQILIRNFLSPLLKTRLYSGKEITVNDICKNIVLKFLSHRRKYIQKKSLLKLNIVDYILNSEGQSGIEDCFYSKSMFHVKIKTIKGDVFTLSGRNIKTLKRQFNVLKKY